MLHEHIAISEKIVSRYVFYSTVPLPSFSKNNRGTCRNEIYIAECAICNTNFTTPSDPKLIDAALVQLCTKVVQELRRLIWTGGSKYILEVHLKESVYREIQFFIMHCG